MRNTCNLKMRTYAAVLLRAMRRIYIVVFMSISLMLNASGCSANQEVGAGATGKSATVNLKAYITKLVEEKAFQVTSDTKDVKFCQSLLEDLKAGKFEEIPPLAEAGTYDDPKFSNLHLKCDDFHSKGRMDFVHFGTIRGMPQQDYSSSAFRAYSLPQKARHKENQLYLLSSEQLRHANTYEGGHSRGDIDEGHLALYKFADLNSCKYPNMSDFVSETQTSHIGHISFGAAAGDNYFLLFGFPHGETTLKTHGVISYQDRPYIFGNLHNVYKTTSARITETMSIAQLEPLSIKQSCSFEASAVIPGEKQ